MTFLTKCYVQEIIGIDIVCDSDGCIIMTYSRILCFWNIFTG